MLLLASMTKGLMKRFALLKIVDYVVSIETQQMCADLIRLINLPNFHPKHVGETFFPFGEMPDEPNIDLTINWRIA